MSGVDTYGQAGYILALVKITDIIGFIVSGIILNSAGTPEQGFIGLAYWRGRGPFNNGFKGFCTIILVCYAAHKVIHRAREYIPARSVDVDTGRREYNVHSSEARDEEDRAVWPRPGKVCTSACAEIP